METVSPRIGANEFRVHQRPPLPTTTLNRKRIIAVVAVLALVVAAVMVFSLSSKKKATEEESAKTTYSPSPNETVQGLPSDYLHIREPEKEKSIDNKNSAVVEVPPPSIEEKLMEEARVKKLKNILLARESGLSFREVSLGEGSKQRSYGKNGDSSGGTFDVASLGAVPGQNGQLNGNSRDDDNRQDDKNSFLESGNSSGDVLKNRIRGPASKYQLTAGTVIPGVLLTGLNSDLPGQILGQVSQDVFDSVTGKYKLIPMGARVVGQYDSRIVYGQQRALIVWTRILFPNGDSINLEKMPGVDMSGYAGVSDLVNNHYGRLLMGVVMSSLLGAGAQMAQSQNYQTINPQFDQLALQGAASQINQTGQQITRKNLNIQPTIEIRPGHRFNVFVTKDVVLKDYKE